MKIVREDMKVTKFHEVDIGAVFVQDDVVYMKTPNFCGIEEEAYQEEHCKFNAICLHNGNLSYFNYSDTVKVYCDACLVVK